MRSLFFLVAVAVSGVAFADTVNFTGISQGLVESPLGQSFAYTRTGGSSGTLNVRKLSGDLSILSPGSGPDVTGFFAYQNAPNLTPVVFRFAFSSNEHIEITENEGLTALETNEFTLPSGAWTVVDQQFVDISQVGPQISIHGNLSTPPYGYFKMTGDGASFDYRIIDAPGYPQYGSSISLNILAQPSTVSGTVVLQDDSATPAGTPVQFQVVQSGVVVETRVVALGQGGTFTFTTGATGTARIFADYAQWVRRGSGIVTLSQATPATVSLSLPNGDADGSGEVDAADIDLVIAHFGETPSDPGWRASSDIDRSQEVDAADIDIVIAHFGSVDD